MSPVITMFKIKVTASVTRRAFPLRETNLSLEFCIIGLKGYGAVKATLQENVLIFTRPVKFRVTICFFSPSVLDKYLYPNTQV